MDLSTSLAPVDLALLLGVGLLGGLTAVAIRRMRSARPVFAAGGGLAVAAALSLCLGRRSRATTGELRRALPGDDLIPRPCFTTDRAPTIRARAIRRAALAAIVSSRA